jgi:hypothetical protein
MYTIAQIEQVAISVFSGVVDPEDPPTRRRMATITNLFGTMLANNTKSVDEETLDEATARLLSHYLRKPTKSGAQGAELGLASGVT